MEEVWKPIPGFEGYYEASNMGNIRSLDRFTKNRWGSCTFHKSQLMKCRIVKNGYAHVKLTKDGNKFEPLVHRIIADMFIPNPDNLPQINHKNGDKSDNRVSNLEWCTSSQNQLHSRRVLKRHCGKSRKPVICLETGETFDSLTSAGKTLGINSGGIYYVCEGRNKQAKGMHFKYADIK